MRVPLDQSGAAAAARWIARSGLRERSARVSAREPRGEHERLAVRAAARRRGEELEVRARVRLHRARDVAQHHEPPRRRPAAPRWRRCTGSPPLRRLPRSVRRMSMRVPWRPPPARRVRRSGVASSQARHQAVELGQLVGLQGVEALAREPLLVARELSGMATSASGPSSASVAPRRGGGPSARRAPATSGRRRVRSSGAGFDVRSRRSGSNGCSFVRRRRPRRRRRRTPSAARV